MERRGPMGARVPERCVPGRRVPSGETFPLKLPRIELTIILQSYEK
jgi:hypothetical protein